MTITIEEAVLKDTPFSEEGVKEILRKRLFKDEKRKIEIFGFKDIGAGITNTDEHRFRVYYRIYEIGELDFESYSQELKLTNSELKSLFY